MKIIFLIITLITFTIFFIEAFIHFNIGKNGNDCVSSENHKYVNLLNSNIKIHIPNKNEIINIGFTVLSFSLISGIISSYIIKYHLIN
jgi:hypothetical protein